MAAATVRHGTRLRPFTLPPRPVRTPDRSLAVEVHARLAVVGAVRADPPRVPARRVCRPGHAAPSRGHGAREAATTVAYRGRPRRAVRGARAGGAVAGL